MSWLIVKALSLLRVALPWVAKHAVPIMTCLICIVVGFGMAWEFQSNRLKNREEKIRMLNSQVAVAKDANDTNAATIEALKAEVQAGKGLSTQRFRGQELTLKELRRIDSLLTVSRTSEKRQEGVNAKGSGDAVDDPLFAELDSMFSDGEADSEGGVHQASDSGAPVGTGMVPSQVAEAGVLYCLNPDNARNLLKNWTLIRGRGTDLELIIGSLRGN